MGLMKMRQVDYEHEKTLSLSVRLSTKSEETREKKFYELTCKGLENWLGKESWRHLDQLPIP